MANDIFSTLRTYLNKVTDEKNASEVASSVNQWLREGGEALKIKIEDEVERSVSKMGFVKRGEFEALKEEVTRLKMASSVSAKSTDEKTSTKKAAVKKTSTKKAAVKKTSTKKASK
jgi:BMFP domain-containing protein YqiC